MINAQLSDVSVLADENQRLRDIIQSLLEENKKLSIRIRELEERLHANSNNSSKAPSQDPFRSPRQSQPSGRKPGGQPGHAGHAREMAPPDNVTRYIEVKPEYCSRCGASMSEAGVIATDCKQVTELSGISADVTQYNIQTCKCPICKKRVKARVPEEAKRAFGPRLMAFITMLNGEAHVTKRNICAVLGHLGIKISLGSVSNTHRLASRVLEHPAEEIRTIALQSSNINADESSWRLRNKRCWLWVGATKVATFFCIDPSRSQIAFQKIFHGFQNILTTDRYAVYNIYDGKKQTCLAHVRRDFIKVSERPLSDGAIGRVLCDQLDIGFALWKQFKAGALSRSELQQQAQASIENIQLALTVGAMSDQITSKTTALCHHLLERFDTLWTFLSQEDVEPTNNLAERSLRPAVIYRKLTGGSRSEWGIAFVERLLTLVCTCKQRAKNIFTFLIKAFQAHLSCGPAPPIFT